MDASGRLINGIWCLTSATRGYLQSLAGDSMFTLAGGASGSILEENECSIT